jgi:hypothetical protein
MNRINLKRKRAISDIAHQCFKKWIDRKTSKALASQPLQLFLSIAPNSQKYTNNSLMFDFYLSHTHTNNNNKKICICCCRVLEKDFDRPCGVVLDELGFDQSLGQVELYYCWQYSEVELQLYRNAVIGNGNEAVDLRVSSIVVQSPMLNYKADDNDDNDDNDNDIITSPQQHLSPLAVQHIVKREASPSKLNGANKRKKLSPQHPSSSTTTTTAPTTNNTQSIISVNDNTNNNNNSKTTSVQSDSKNVLPNTSEQTIITATPTPTTTTIQPQSTSNRPFASLFGMFILFYVLVYKM